jgi:hypothetical protein
MKRLTGLAVALTVTIIVIGLAPIATAASAQTITLAQTPPQDPCSGLPFQEGCEVATAIGKVWAELERASHPNTAAQLYFDSFAYVRDCAPSFITGKLGWVLTLSQWKQILGGIFKILNNNQIQNFWDRYKEIRDFPLTPFGGCFPPAWVIKANHPGLWKALSNVWLVPVPGGAILLPIFSLPHSSSPPPGPCTPAINAVGPFEATVTQTVEITGSCFGTGNTSSGADTAYFRISDLTAGWNACWTGDPGTDQVSCSIASWTNNEIIFSGYTGDYGEGSWVVTSGDLIEIQVWNPQSGKGPATFEVTAGGSSGCPNPNGCVG